MSLPIRKMRPARELVFLLATFALCLSPIESFAGYTQYFSWHQQPDAAELKRCIEEMRLIIVTRTNILVGPDGTASSIVRPSRVDLNGIGDDQCEPFVFPGMPGFNFCKTGANHYDAVVTACLLVAHDHFPSSVLSISSDGSWKDGDWEEGAKLYTSILKRPARNPLDESLIPRAPLHVWWLIIAGVLLLAIFVWWLIKAKS